MYLNLKSYEHVNDFLVICACIYMYMYICTCTCMSMINPQHACAGGLRYLSCVCVCLSVTTLAPTSLVSML